MTEHRHNHCFYIWIFRLQTRITNPFLPEFCTGFKSLWQEISASKLKVTTTHTFLLITNLMHFFFYLFIHLNSLHVSSIKFSSSGDRIVLIHHLVWLVCLSDCLACRHTGMPSSHFDRISYQMIINNNSISWWWARDARNV
jgi:hypothetical protein